MREVWPGRPSPLGAHFDGGGVNFAVYSERATAVDVCLYDPEHPSRELERLPLVEQTQFVWHGYVPGLQPGALYGFRARGPWDPARGLRFNAQKLLMDPYARALTGKVDPKGPIHAYRRAHKDPDLLMDHQDSAGAMPRSVVVDSRFDWKDERRPQTPWHQTVLYEVHVKGFTRLHPEVPERLRGTYGGFAHPAAIAHLKRLGVTAVELLPIHEVADEGFLHDKGLTNYWGYSTLGYFAPDQRFSASGSRGAQVDEFKYMVKELHQAGIEVILDVVYNHTGEGNHLGPTLSLRGLDNATYYWLKPDDPRYYLDFTGTGNSLNVQHPQTLKLILDSLRYWVEEMHVDGFRFDLATTLGRTPKGYDRNHAFFQIVHQDPVLSQVKLISEPWDVGPGGYQVGNFPLRWSEWNGKYRDAIRRYWKGDESQAADLGYRLTGSSDLYQLSGRRVSASINFITAHDGFTLEDLVSYDHKHNEANGERNNDGANDNHSWNCGVEGPTEDAKVNALREQQKRNFLATLFVSQGVPMLLAGDEFGNTQGGNNNVYCQDNPIAWLDWNLDERRRKLLEFTTEMIRLRMSEPVLQRRRFFRGAHIWDSELKDLAWFRPDGREMKKEDWQKPFVRSLGFLLGGDAIPTRSERGERISGDSILVLMNAHHEPLEFTLPALEWGADWELLVDTGTLQGQLHSHTAAGGHLTLAGRSMVILRRPAVD